MDGDKTNQAMNAWIRGQGGHNAPTQETQPDPGRIPPGNAGAGTGAPPPAPTVSMNDVIRLATGKPTRDDWRP